MPRARSPSAAILPRDWPIDDAGCEALAPALRDPASPTDGVIVRDLSANGVFVGAERRRIAARQHVEVDAERADPSRPVHDRRGAAPRRANDTGARTKRSTRRSIRRSCRSREVSAAAVHRAQSHWAKRGRAAPPQIVRASAATPRCSKRSATAPASTRPCLPAKIPAEVMRRAGASLSAKSWSVSAI